MDLLQRNDVRAIIALAIGGFTFGIKLEAYYSEMSLIEARIESNMTYIKQNAGDIRRNSDKLYVLKSK